MKNLILISAFLGSLVLLGGCSEKLFSQSEDLAPKFMTGESMEFSEEKKSAIKKDNNIVIFSK